jgi:hypothetical protein
MPVYDFIVIDNGNAGQSALRVSLARTTSVSHDFRD